MKNYLLFLMLGTLIALSSCMSLDKAIKKVTATETNAELALLELNKKQALAVAENCAREFPISEKEGPTDTELHPGNTAELKDDIKEAEKAAADMQKEVDDTPITPGCEPDIAVRDKMIAELRGRISRLSITADNLRADVERITKTRYQENTARVKALELQLQAMADTLQAREGTIKATNARAKKAESTASKRGWWLAGLAVLFFASIAMWIRPKLL